MMSEKSGYIRVAARRGYVVETSEGCHSVRLSAGDYQGFPYSPKRGVPEIFVLPREMFNWNKGINVADMEFPIYYHFFIRGQRPLICGTIEQARLLATASPGGGIRSA